MAETHLFKSARWGPTGAPANLLVEEGRVRYRGPEVHAADRVTDLSGEFILPGFVDCHCHILPAGLDLQRLDLSNCRTREEVLSALSACAAQLRDGEWLLASHYDQTRFDDGRHLTARELDAATFGLPTALRHSSGHACVVSTEALKAARVTPNAPDPPGGRIERDSAGNATGLLLETAMDLINPALPRFSIEQMVEAILAAAQSMSAYGVTAASDMMTGHYGLEDELAAYEKAAERGCPVRMRLYIQWSDLFESTRPSKADLPDSHVLRIAGTKLFADGAIGAATAATYEEYETGGTGTLIYEPDDLRQRILRAADAGFSVAIHSIGDRATDVVLDALEAAPNPSRHRIEHAMMLSDDQIERIRSLGVRVVMQPEFLGRFAHTYLRQLGSERASRLKRVNSLLRRGVPVGFSSDRPVVPGDPWHGISRAVERREPYERSENVSLTDAIRLYTQGAADAQGDAGEFGSLQPGQWADFQVYESDPMEEAGHPAAVFLAGEPQSTAHVPS